MYRLLLRNPNNRAVSPEDYKNNSYFAPSSMKRASKRVKDLVKNNILNIIGSPKTFFISGTEKDTIGEDELEDYAIVGTDVRNAFSTTQFNLDTEYNGITIEFTKAGTKKYHELTRQVAATEASKIYFYIGGEKQTSLEIEESTNDFLSFYSSGYDKNVAQNFALQILMSSTGVDVEIVSYGLASATLESRGVVTSASIFVSLLLLLLILFPVFFKQLGLVADLSVVLGVVFAIFFLEALPVVAMSIAGAVGCIFGLGLLGAVHAMYLNKMKKEFMYLHRLPLSAKTAYKKYWLKVLDICSITFIGGLVLAVWNIPFVSTLGVCLAVFSFVSVFEGLVIFKDFVTWYVTINNKDYKKVNFKKGDINE